MYKQSLLNKIAIKTTTHNNVSKGFRDLNESQGNTLAETLEFLLNFYETRKSAPVVEISKSDLANKNSRKIGVAFERIDLFVKAIMKHNDVKNSDKIHIGKSLVRKELVVNANAIKSYFATSANEIETNHKNNNILQNENLKFRRGSKSFKDIYEKDENENTKLIVQILKKENIYDMLIGD